jgi:hypothetical protein
MSCASRLGCGLPCVWVSPFVGSLAVCLATGHHSTSTRTGTIRVSQVPGTSLRAYHALRWTPADPRGPYHNGPSVLASAALKAWPSALARDEAVSSLRECGLPCGLRASLCTLQLTCSAFTSSVAVATLGMSGWLDLTQQGLSPCKKRQASLGALTTAFSCGVRSAFKRHHGKRCANGSSIRRLRVLRRTVSQALAR